MICFPSSGFRKVINFSLMLTSSFLEESESELELELCMEGNRYYNIIIEMEGMKNLLICIRSLN